MSRKLQLWRGLEAGISTLAAGEPGFCADSYKLFIGSAAGNQEIHFGRQIIGGDSSKNLGIGTGALGSIAAGLTVNDTVIGVGALPSDQLTGGNVVVGADAAKGIPYLLNSVVVGWKALYSATVTQDSSVIIGATAGYYLDSCNKDVIIGQNAFHPALGSENVVIGTNACHDTTAKSGMVVIGNAAAYYETGSNKLFIDNTNRASEADARIKALIYGVFDALTANQLLWINGRFGVLLSEVLPAANDAAAAAAGVLVGQFYRTNADPSILCIRTA